MPGNRKFAYWGITHYHAFSSLIRPKLQSPYHMTATMLKSCSGTVLKLVKYAAPFFCQVRTGAALLQGSYASGKCQGNLNFFKVRELSGNFMLCQGKMNFC